MKKYIIGAIVGAIIVSSVPVAKADVTSQEFMSPVVQTIIQQLEGRITDLTAQVDDLNAQINTFSKQQVSCPTYGSVVPVQSSTQINPQEAALKNQISTLEAQLATLQQSALDELQTYNNAPKTGGVGLGAVPAATHATFIQNNTYQQQTIQVQLQSLNEQLDLLK